MKKRTGLWSIFASKDSTSSPPTLVLHHAGINRGGRAGERDTGLRVDNRNDFPRTSSRRLLEMHDINITIHGSRGNIVDIRCGGRAGRERNAWRHLLLGGLDLMLQRRRLWRAARQG